MEKNVMKVMETWRSVVVTASGLFSPNRNMEFTICLPGNLVPREQSNVFLNARLRLVMRSLFVCL